MASAQKSSQELAELAPEVEVWQMLETPPSEVDDFQHVECDASAIETVPEQLDATAVAPCKQPAQFFGSAISDQCLDGWEVPLSQYSAFEATTNAQFPVSQNAPESEHSFRMWDVVMQDSDCELLPQDPRLRPVCAYAPSEDSSLSWEQVDSKSDLVANILERWEHETVVKGSQGDIASGVQVVEIWERESMISTEKAPEGDANTIDKLTHVYDRTRQHAPSSEERRQLCDTLWQANPAWLPENVASAEKELARVKIFSLQDLIAAMSGNLRDVLGRQQKAFAAGEIGALRRYLGIARGGGLLAARASHKEQVEQSQRRKLCNLLWEAQPAWTSEEFLAAHRKLLRVGVRSIAALMDKLSLGMHDQLLKVGFKELHAESILSLVSLQLMPLCFKLY